jgi:hypothetical protein
MHHRTEKQCCVDDGSGKNVYYRSSMLRNHKQTGAGSNMNAAKKIQLTSSPVLPVRVNCRAKVITFVRWQVGGKQVSVTE